MNYNIFEMLKNRSNPQQVVMTMLQGPLANTPMGSNLLKLIQENNGAEIERIARNMVASQGKDFDTEFNSFKPALGIK